MKNKIQELIALYGKLAFITYFIIFALVFSGFYVAIQSGVDLEEWSLFRGRLGQAGTIVVAYVATKITQPIRIAAAVAITPIVAQFIEKKESRDENEVSS